MFTFLFWFFSFFHYGTPRIFNNWLKWGRSRTMLFLGGYVNIRRFFVPCNESPSFLDYFIFFDTCWPCNNFHEKKARYWFTCILDPIWKYHAFTWFRLTCRSNFVPCGLHGDYVNEKTLGNKWTFFLGDGGSRNKLHGIFSWTIFQPRCYYHETYSFYHDFLPCCFWIFVQRMYAFSGFFDHAERSHVSFLPF